MSTTSSSSRQMLSVCSILEAEYRMYRNIHRDLDKHDQRYAPTEKMMNYLHKNITRMTKIIKGK